jgi:hypothetical protein
MTLLAALAMAATTALSGPAQASPVERGPRAKVEWVRVEVPEGPAAAKLTKTLKEALKTAAKRADFGKSAGTVALTARVVEMRTEQQGDVLRVTCTIMGRVAKGPGARSRISYGGSPDKREELEKQVLTMVANGLVARLAQIVRTQAPKVR